MSFPDKKSELSQSNLLDSGIISCHEVSIVSVSFPDKKYDSSQSHLIKPTWEWYLLPWRLHRVWFTAHAQDTNWGLFCCTSCHFLFSFMFPCSHNFPLLHVEIVCLFYMFVIKTMLVCSLRARGWGAASLFTPMQLPSNKRQSILLWEHSQLSSGVYVGNKKAQQYNRIKSSFACEWGDITYFHSQSFKGTDFPRSVSLCLYRTDSCVCTSGCPLDHSLCNLAYGITAHYGWRRR